MVVACSSIMRTIEVDEGFQRMITFENGITSSIEVGTTNFLHILREQQEQP